MKLKVTLVPVGLVLGFGAYVALHPGVAYAAPRLAAGTPTRFAAPATYSVDDTHTSLYFEITHLGLSQVHGRINKFKGKVHEDAADLSKSFVEFSADVDSIDTAVPPRDAHLKTADFFDVAKFPQLTFKSTKIEKTEKGYLATGDLTIHGKTKSIAIPFKHYGPLDMKGIAGQAARVGIVADPITIKRSDFGVGNMQRLPDGTLGASDEVIVHISLEATLDKA